MVEVAAAPPGCIFFQLRERSPIIPLHRAKPMPVDRNDPNRELYSIAVVTVDESSFPEMRRALATSFRTTLASTEEQIKALVEDPNLHGILFDLDSVGEGAPCKELIVKAIVPSGSRADNPYVCLNCSALPETLIESELFGYEKGAFTGADMARPGLIETAHNGTLFLDEIPSLNPSLQSKLLRVLQEHSVQRLGGRSTKTIDFRLICATNEDLEELVRKGRFREYLCYRINVVPSFVPPLPE